MILTYYTTIIVLDLNIVLLGEFPVLVHFVLETEELSYLIYKENIEQNESPDFNEIGIITVKK